MLRTLQTVRSGPRTGRPRRTKLLAMVAALALLVPIGIGLGNAVENFFGGSSTQTVDRSPDALLLSVRDIADYHAATGTYQVLVDVAHENPNLPRLLSSDRSTLFATGSVDARVDFSRLGSGAVSTSPDGKQATIHLPAPTLAPAVLDPAQTRVVGRQRGIVQRVEDAIGDQPQDDSELYAIASAKLNAAAATSDLTARAADNTRSMLTGLSKSLGYDAVTVTFDPPAPPPAP
jgi:Protein of unknown function (DUF4230)